MKILRTTVGDKSVFSIVGLESEDFYAIKHALAARASIASDPDRNSNMMDYEKDQAIITWNEFSRESHQTIEV